MGLFVLPGILSSSGPLYAASLRQRDSRILQQPRYPSLGQASRVPARELAGTRRDDDRGGHEQTEGYIWREAQYHLYFTLQSEHSPVQSSQGFLQRHIRTRLTGEISEEYYSDLRNAETSNVAR